MSLLRHFSTVGGGTMASRVLGFVRDALLAALLGKGSVADAYLAAFRLPNLFRRLFAEGAFNSAFVPLYAQELEGGGQDAARRFARDVFVILLIVLLLLSALFEIFMPVFVYIFTPGFAVDPPKFELTVLLSRITFPYLLCMSLVAMLSGVLNAHHRYFAAAFAPVLLNVIMVSVLVSLHLVGATANPVTGITLAWGVSMAGFAQLLLLAFACRRIGFRLALVRPRLTPKVTKLLVLAVPAAIAGGITQINIFVGQIIASQEGGAISVLYYADRIYQLPLGVIGIAVGVVLLPELSRHLRAGAHANAVRTQNQALDFSLILTIPAAFALATIPMPVVNVLFQRGAFSAEVTAETASALTAFAIGLPAFVLIKVFSPGFFARLDTRTPMLFAAISMLVNVSGSLLMFPTLSFVGIALATTLAGWVNAGLLFVTLYRRGQWVLGATRIRRLAWVVVCASVMALALYLLDTFALHTAQESRFSVRLLYLAGMVVGGALIYFVLIHVSGVARLADLRRAMRHNDDHQ